MHMHDTCLCNSSGPIVIGHIVVKVQPPQLLRVLDQLRNCLACSNGTSNILECQLL